MAGRRFTDDEVIDFLRANNGMVYKTAEAMDVSHQAIYARLKKSKKVRLALELILGSMGDKVEDKIREAIDRGEWPAIQFYAKTRLKDRGYTERQEITGADGGPVRQAIGPDLTGYSDEHLRQYLAQLAKAGIDIASRND